MTERKVSRDRLAEMSGVALRYKDVWQKETLASPETIRTVLAAMGLPAENEDAAEASITALEERAWRQPLEPVSVLPEGAPDCRLTVIVSRSDPARSVAWPVERRDGHSEERRVGK